ncbi:Uncharacterized protein YR821_2431 [Yersinia ruckeri]|uniref:Uncharacterized protein n=1 Tax=Yersinia ruckeri TaxID=29486 RepID=A0A0A8VIU7_YERRU|nr:hypothetical protein yruck0001_9090 [Yersinia ruckeri ATCC 29473]QTD77349.1 Uncharacterized protein YR821_2431 [Yersinia ruckeri]CEK28263.1 hypothetical protein CSF007_12620 [Yersinia ruckeri]
MAEISLSIKSQVFFKLIYTQQLSLMIFLLMVFRHSARA